jgi:hypothetical protein
MSIFGLFSKQAQTTPESDFWVWFQKNEPMLFDFEKDQEGVFAGLAAAMHKVHPNLTFEFGPKENGRRDFVISADGFKEAFPRVETLYASALRMPRWKFIKFRPRRQPADISFRGVSVRARDVSVSIEPDGAKAGITVFLPGYSKDTHETFAGVAFLLLDQALGEYDVETRVGFIEVQSSASKTGKAVPLNDLVRAFDNLLCEEVVLA